MPTNENDIVETVAALTPPAKKRGRPPLDPAVKAARKTGRLWERLEELESRGRYGNVLRSLDKNAQAFTEAFGADVVVAKRAQITELREKTKADTPTV